MKLPTILCFGELLIDMISQNTGNLVHSRGFLKKFGGAPANTAMGLAKLGEKVAFAGKVGDDPFGKFLKHTLEKNKVDTSSLLISKTERTTLAFVSLDEEGRRDFFFYKGAHETIHETEMNLPASIKIFHFGSLTQIHDIAKQTTHKLISQAKAQNAIISYDPNIRESLWGDLQKAKQTILTTMKSVDIFKINEEEAVILSDTNTPEKAIEKLYNPHLDAMFVTAGKFGCYYRTKKHQGKIPTIHVNVVDTTGAGDAFNAGYLHALAKTGRRFSDMSKDELENYLKRATVIATLTTTKKGAVTAFPTKKEREKALKDIE